MNAVLNLGVCRSLLKVSDGLRLSIVNGRARGVAVCIKNEDGTETVTFAGEYEDDPEQAARAALAMVWETARKPDQDTKT